MTLIFGRFSLYASKGLTDRIMDVVREYAKELKQPMTQEQLARAAHLHGEPKAIRAFRESLDNPQLKRDVFQMQLIHDSPIAVSTRTLNV
jgi:hypothetical protein